MLKEEFTLEDSQSGEIKVYIATDTYRQFIAIIELSACGGQLRIPNVRHGTLQNILSGHYNTNGLLVMKDIIGSENKTIYTFVCGADTLDSISIRMYIDGETVHTLCEKVKKILDSCTNIE